MRFLKNKKIARREEKEKKKKNKRAESTDLNELRRFRTSLGCFFWVKIEGSNFRTFFSARGKVPSGEKLNIEINKGAMQKVSE